MSVRPFIPENPSREYACELDHPNVLISWALKSCNAVTCEDPPLNPPSNGMIV